MNMWQIVASGKFTGTSG